MQAITRILVWAVAGLSALNWLGVEGAACADSQVGETCRMRSAPASPTMEALAGRIAKAGAEGGTKLVSEFVAANRGRFPLVEDSLVTLVYSGKVAVRVCVPSDLNGWDTKAHEMQRLGEADLYYRTLVLPQDARIDYKFYVDGAWMLDPLNARTVKGGFGDNSAFAMPGYIDPWEIAPVDSAERGRIEEHQFSSKILGNTRRIQIYLPLGYRAAKVMESWIGDCDDKGGERDLGFAGTYPVVLVQDGGEYITPGSMAHVLDNLIARKPANTAIMGASLGGEISLMIALNHPDIFGKCCSQSGAFAIEEGKQIGMVSGLIRQPVDIYLDCGTFESLLDSNRAMRDVLAGKDYRLLYLEFNEGHSWGNWRAHIDDALTFFWGK